MRDQASCIGLPRILGWTCGRTGYGVEEFIVRQEYAKVVEGSPASADGRYTTLQCTIEGTRSHTDAVVDGDASWMRLTRRKLFAKSACHLIYRVMRRIESLGMCRKLFVSEFPLLR